MVQPTILALGALVAAAAAGMARRAIRTHRIVAQVEQASIVSPRDLPRAIVRTHGVLACDQPLRAPLSGRDAIYYFVKAESIPEPGRPPRRLAGAKQWVQAILTDGDHGVRLAPWTPLVASSQRDEHILTPSDLETPGREALIEELGMGEHHVRRLQRVRLVEYRFEPGDHVYVTGMHDPDKGIYRDRRKPFVVSAFDDLGFLQGLRHEMLLFAALSPLMAAASLVLVLISFT